MFARLVSGPIWLYAAGGALIAGFMGGWTVRDWRCDAAKAAEIERAVAEMNKITERQNNSAAELEVYRNDSEDRTQEARTRIRTIYLDRPVDVSCDLHPDARRLHENNRANANAAAAGEPSIPLPAAAAYP